VRFRALVPSSGLSYTVVWLFWCCLRPKMSLSNRENLGLNPPQKLNVTSMTSKIRILELCLGLVTASWIVALAQDAPSPSADWPQWAHTSLHNGSTQAVGQSPKAKLAHFVYDPFASKEKAEEAGKLLAHYQVPLVDGNSVFLEYKTGKYVSCSPPGSGKPYPCGPDDWNTEIWNERAFTWKNGSLVEAWNFRSDWKPEPNTDIDWLNKDGLWGWEPVFHAALWNGNVFVPGFGGTIYKVAEENGKIVARYNPFSSIDRNRYVSGPLTIDAQGNVYYNVLELAAKDPWSTNIRNSWLVKVRPNGTVTKVSYSKLTKQGTTDGSQRPGVNIAPAVSADVKTIYTASVAHFNPSNAYMVAVNSDLTPKWHVSLTNLAHGQITGAVYDLSSATPVVLPDNAVLFGVVGGDGSRGYMLKFDSAGNYLTSFDFGWDDTPAVYIHDGTYSVITKNNYYATNGPFYITQLNADLIPEWSYKSADDFEWCVNAPAVDANGTVYADSEDGNLFVIKQGGKVKGKVFLQQSVGAAYTPVSIGRDGKIYTLNDGDMFAVGK
jgi:hypothetical protein